VELVLSGSAAAVERTRALWLLGFAPQAELVVLAVSGPDPAEAAAQLAKSLRTNQQRLARPGAVGAHGVVLTGADRSLPELALPDGHRAGIGSAVPALELARSWQESLLALGFAGILGRGPVVPYAELGALAALAAIRTETADPDTAALRQLSLSEQGRRDLQVLEAYLATASVRDAAAALHLHHSSVARRVRHLGQQLGWDLDRPADRLRAQVALILCRLADRQA
jgi:hypothetical protein